jgi:hypothetical protein
VEQVPGFSKGMVDDLKSGGAKVRSEEGAKNEMLDFAAASQIGRALAPR